jgi:hypothetical protein
VIGRAARFAADFIVGDDVAVAVGVVIALGLAALGARAGDDAWWILPATVPVVLAVSLWRAVRG